jgi:hypothetical protein
MGRAYDLVSSGALEGASPIPDIPINSKARLFGLVADAFLHASISWSRDHHSYPGAVELSQVRGPEIDM